MSRAVREHTRTVTLRALTLTCDFCGASRIIDEDAPVTDSIYGWSTNWPGADGKRRDFCRVLCRESFAETLAHGQPAPQPWPIVCLPGEAT